MEVSKSSPDRVVTVKIYDGASIVCAGNSATFLATQADTGFTYAWQGDEGAGFQNINNRSIHSRVNTIKLLFDTLSTI